MSDNHTKKQRSYNMSRIRSTNTEPEEKVRKWLHSRGFRYRKNVNSLPGRPDIVLRKYKAIIFVHGCFWHKHNCGRFRLPQSNTDYWEKKSPVMLNETKKSLPCFRLMDGGCLLSGNAS